MKKPIDNDRHSARQTRLQALLFAGAALGTTLLTLAGVEPKAPPFRGE